MQEAILKPEESEFKGNPILQLPNGDYSPFSFGVRKAKIILMYIKDIEEFVQDHSPGWSPIDGL